MRARSSGDSHSVVVESSSVVWNRLVLVLVDFLGRRRRKAYPRLKRCERVVCKGLLNTSSLSESGSVKDDSRSLGRL